MHAQHAGAVSGSMGNNILPRNYESGENKSLLLSCLYLLPGTQSAVRDPNKIYLEYKVAGAFPAISRLSLC